ncbi:MAG: DUF4198 domain-containing protein [Gammaproteobacteria bacterium]|nr:DUF4198 domain-containing protein [Gammaproteobacteria bacterium]
MVFSFCKNFFYRRLTVAIVILAVTGSLLLLSTQAVGNMFGLFKKYDVHLSPEVHGVITEKGKAVVGLEVFRGLTYGDEKELVDKTTTDAEGKFSFTEKIIRSRKPGSMFDESTIRQTIDVDYQGEKYILWYTHAIGFEPNLALTERLDNLSCELTNSEEEFEFDSYEYPQAG